MNKTILAALSILLAGSAWSGSPAQRDGEQADRQPPAKMDLLKSPTVAGFLSQLPQTVGAHVKEKAADTEAVPKITASKPVPEKKGKKTETAPPRKKGKKLDVCYLKDIVKDECVYKCRSGRVHKEPVRLPDPFDDQPVLACSQIVILF